jgi:hypothetical protein
VFERSLINGGLTLIHISFARPEKAS